MSEREDRRKHPRFSAKSGVFAVLGPFSSQMGQIIDISKGGLSFQYKEGAESIDGDCEVSILFDGQSSHHTSPFKFNGITVSDIRIKPANPYSTSVARRFSMKFERLTYYQEAWLTECIQKYTLGRAEQPLSSEAPAEWLDPDSTALETADDPGLNRKND